MRKLVVLFCSLLVIEFSMGQNPEVKKSVTFIYSTTLEGEKPLGTAFFIGVNLPDSTSKRAAFLVTAKHVLLNPDSSFRNAIHLRLNTRDSSRYNYVRLAFSGPQQNVFFHPDPTVDVVLISNSPMKTDYDFLPLPINLFLLDREKYKQINEGSETFFAGMFTQFLGDKRNFPILRFGHVSLITDEKIEFVGYKRELTLIESFSYGGNSGSPVFVRSNNNQMKLLGVVNGVFNNFSPIGIMKTGTDIPISISNIGISAITPSYLIGDILKTKVIQALLKEAQMDLVK
jgi:hypothetical protein